LCAIARREVGSCCSGPTCPGCVALPGCVLPSSPSPCGGLSPPRSTTLATTPQPHPAGFPCDRTPPPAWPACHLAPPVPALLRRRVSPAGPPELYPFLRGFPAQERLGPPQCFDASLPAGHGLRTPADLPLLALPDGRVWPSGAFKPSASAMSLCDAVPALQGARSPLRPPGVAVDASPLLCAVSPRLRHGRQTRYGWLAHPYPTGTFPLLETPSLSWRENAARQARPMAEATQERKLSGVACTRWFGLAWRGRWTGSCAGHASWGTGYHLAVLRLLLRLEIPP